MEAPKEVEPCKAIWNLYYYFFVVPKVITRGLSVAITKENTDVTTLTRLSAGSSNNRFGHKLFLVCANFNTRSIKPLLARRHQLRKKKWRILLFLANKFTMRDRSFAQIVQGTDKGRN
jgi:hypothetical protein